MDETESRLTIVRSNYGW